MAADIKLLEELVLRAVERLKALAEERRQLEAEVRSLRSKLESEREAGAAAARLEPWEARREEIVAALQQTLVELRGA